MTTMKCAFVSAVALAAFAAQADVIDRPTGFKIGQRMTLRPYVSMGYTFDSNPDSSRRSSSGSSWCINPGVGFDYAGGNWNVKGAVYYQYHAYSSGYSHQLNTSSFGEQLAFDWTNCEQGKGKGWTLLLNETFQSISQDDDMTTSGGKGLGRDRLELRVSGALDRRFNEHWHAGVNGGYYLLDYDNDVDRYAPLYGWTRWNAGAQIGFTASKWTDVFIAGGYQGYTQDNDVYLGGEGDISRGSRISDRSTGWTLHVGVGSFMTERIEYRLSGGWSVFDYANEKTVNGFTYEGSLKWMIGETWDMMFLATSYYQPSEREYGSATRTDALSWGVKKSMVRGKLDATFDVAYRHETHTCVDFENSDYHLDILTFRLGLNYNINRFLSAFGRIEYQTEICDGDNLGNEYDYDRWRATIGLRLAY